ncbi:MAG: hypothetical protein WD225_09690, partial [Ilumatobacteraceae bacterium]
AVGPAVRDYRLGLGMPRRAKAIAIGMIGTAGTLSGVFGLTSLIARLVLAMLCAMGIAVLLWHVPTRETVVAGPRPFIRSGRARRPARR